MSETTLPITSATGSDVRVRFCPSPTGTPKVNPATPAETPKTTDKPADTGAGKPADTKATAEARTPRAKNKSIPPGVLIKKKT